MNRTFFGPRATRRAQLKRRLGATALATAVSLLVGVPAGMGPLQALWFLGGDTSGAESERPAKGIQASESQASIVKFRREVFKKRAKPEKPETEPSPTETEEPVETVAASGGSIEEIIGTAAAEFGLDPGYLTGVASCESGLDPSAHNAAGYHGLFQFDEQTWSAYGYGSIWDASAQARTAARLIAAGEGSRWPNCA
ncbi:MAG: transglycosylase family protein [Actinomycetota bacterium]